MASNPFDVQGMKELRNALNRLPDRIQDRVLKSAIRAGGNEVVKQARKELKNSKYDMSTLSKNIGQKVLKPKNYSIVTIIGPRVGTKTKDGNKANDAWYAHIFEYGTLGSRSEPLAPSTKRKKHDPMPTGLPAQPFLRPALDKSKSIALEKAGKKLWDGIKREVAKL